MSAPAFIYPPLQPPSICDMLITYLGNLMTPTPVDTRVPEPAASEDVINGFIRVESGDSPQHSICAWDLNFVFHCYDPDESVADQLSRKCGAYLGAATGLTVNGNYIQCVPHIIAGKQLSDPDVNLPRWRGAGIWRVQGQPLAGPTTPNVLPDN